MQRLILAILFVLATCGAATAQTYTYYMPLAETTAARWTGLSYVNLGPDAATVTRTIHDAGGGIVDQVSHDLAAGAKYVGGVDALGHDRWIVIESDQPLMGLAFIGSSTSPEYIFDVPFMDSAATKLGIAHLADDMNFDSKVVVTNPGAQTASVVLKAHAGDGTLIKSTAWQLPGHGLAVFETSQLSGMESGEIYLVVESGQPVCAFGLYSGLEQGLVGIAGVNSSDIAAPPDNVTDPLGGMRFFWVQGGEFQMGSYGDEAFANEWPVHQVTVPGFWMGLYEVTNAQYRLFDPDHDSGSYGGYPLNGDYQPVVNVSWDDVQAYIQWLEEQTGGTFRLPSEAEWEYACRAGTTTSRFWGDGPSGACAYGNVADRTGGVAFGWPYIHSCNDGYAASAPVGSYNENALGLHDTLGNVWEWVEDLYHDSYNGAPGDGSAWITGGDGERVCRGGSWQSGPDMVRSSARVDAPSGALGADLGFRLVRVY